MSHPQHSDGNLRALVRPEYPDGKLKALVQPGQTWLATIHGYDSYGAPTMKTRLCQVLPEPSGFHLASPDRLDDPVDWWTVWWPYDHQVWVDDDGIITLSETNPHRLYLTLTPPETSCTMVAVVGEDIFPCRSHGGGRHHFAAYWPACPAPFCLLPPDHRDLHDIPSGTAGIAEKVRDAR